MTTNPNERATQLLSHSHRYLSKQPLVSPVLSRYEFLKSSNSVLDASLSLVESSIFSVSVFALQSSLTLYGFFVERPTQKAIAVLKQGAHKVSCVAVRGKNLLVETTTLGVGVSVVLTQLTLAFTAGVAVVILDGLKAAKRSTRSVVETAKAIEQRSVEKVAEARTEAKKLASIPIDFVAENLHSALDVVDGVVEHFLKAPVDVAPDASLTTRMWRIALATRKGLSNQAHESVIDPTHKQLVKLVDEMKRRLELVDTLRQQGQWAKARVSSSIIGLKRKLEDEARRVKSSPEAILIHSIHSSSLALSRSLVALKERNSEVLGDVSSVSALISYLESIQMTFSHTNNIYDVRDEVVTKARENLSSLSEKLHRF